MMYCFGMLILSDLFQLYFTNSKKSVLIDTTTYLNWEINLCVQIFSENYSRVYCFLGFVYPQILDHVVLKLYVKFSSLKIGMCGTIFDEFTPYSKSKTGRFNWVILLGITEYSVKGV